MISSWLRRLPPFLSVFAERFDTSPLTTLDELANFVRTRAAYIAQTSLYGYLKTRMGTSYRKIFEDPQFSPIIHASTVRLFSSCLADLAIYTVARLQLAPDDANNLAMYLYKEAITRGVPPTSAELVEADRAAQLQQRLAGLDWQWAAQSLNAFAWSERDIVRYAPVIDSYKKLDAEIIGNSIRFRWCDVCEQLKKRLDAEQLAQSWQEKRML